MTLVARRGSIGLRGLSARPPPFLTQPLKCPVPSLPDATYRHQAHEIHHFCSEGSLDIAIQHVVHNWYATATERLV